jgi:hypothetical protein
MGAYCNGEGKPVLARYDGFFMPVPEPVIVYLGTCLLRGEGRAAAVVSYAVEATRPWNRIAVCIRPIVVNEVPAVAGGVSRVRCVIALRIRHAIEIAIASGRSAVSAAVVVHVDRDLIDVLAGAVVRGAGVVALPAQGREREQGYE